MNTAVASFPCRLCDLARVAMWLPLCALLGSAVVAQPVTGTVRGTVSNADTKLFLESALVSIPALKRSVFTDRQGAFQISGLPAGEHTVQVTYTGLPPEEVPVRITSGAATQLAVELRESVYQMATFEVSAEKQGNALAIAQQRAADNVKNIVAADAFGSAGEGNVADLLQRLPGITVSYTSADPDQVSIRGVSPELSTVTIDGARSPTRWRAPHAPFASPSPRMYRCLKASRSPRRSRLTWTRRPLVDPSTCAPNRLSSRR